MFLVYGKNLQAPLRWHTLLTSGSPLMTFSVPVPVTTLDNFVRLQVPDGERWVLLGAHLVGPTLASGDAKISLYITDSENYNVAFLTMASVTTASYMSFPNGDDIGSPYNNKSGNGPIVLYEGQKIVIRWHADADVTPSSGYYYLNVLRFEVHDQI